MKKIVYANGDSFTYGMEILGDDDRTPANKELAYPAKVAKALNIPKVFNGAFIGAGNEFIFRQTMFELIELERQGIDPKDVLVLIGWTVPFRSEINLKEAVTSARAGKIIASDNETEQKYLENYPEFTAFGNIFISAFAGTKYHVDKTSVIDITDARDFHINYIWDWDLEYNKWFCQVIALESFLRSKGYDFLFFNAIHAFNLDLEKLNNQAKHYRHLLDGPNYFRFLDWGWSDWGHQKFPETVTYKSHFKEEMHEKFAGMLVQHLNYHKLAGNE